MALCCSDSFLNMHAIVNFNLERLHCANLQTRHIALRKIVFCCEFYEPEQWTTYLRAESRSSWFEQLTCVHQKPAILVLNSSNFNLEQLQTRHIALRKLVFFVGWTTYPFRSRRSAERWLSRQMTLCRWLSRQMTLCRWLSRQMTLCNCFLWVPLLNLTNNNQPQQNASKSTSKSMCNMQQAPRRRQSLLPRHDPVLQAQRHKTPLEGTNQKTVPPRSDHGRMFCWQKQLERKQRQQWKWRYLHLPLPSPYITIP